MVTLNGGATTSHTHDRGDDERPRPAPAPALSPSLSLTVTHWVDLRCLALQHTTSHNRNRFTRSGARRTAHHVPCAQRTRRETRSHCRCCCCHRCCRRCCHRCCSHCRLMTIPTTTPIDGADDDGEMRPTHCGRASCHCDPRCEACRHRPQPGCRRCASGHASEVGGDCPSATCCRVSYAHHYPRPHARGLCVRAWRPRRALPHCQRGRVQG